MNDSRDSALQLLQQWYEGFRGAAGQDPERYVVCAGLAVLEAARTTLPLQRSDFITNKNQVKTGGPFIKKILTRYGETRAYAAEGGRTTRGTVPAAERLAGGLNGLTELAAAPVDERLAAIDVTQAWLADRAKAYFDQQRLAIEVDLQRPAAQIVADILATAGAKAGPVAQHLVGAKLALRFRGTDIQIENHSFTTADQQLGRPGDFTVRDGVFHVTVAPSLAVIEKCRRNLRNGRRAYLLVPDSVMQAARQLARVEGLEHSIGIHSSIESFVGQNVEEIGEYERPKLVDMFRELLAEYNRRVTEVETDRSLLMEIPEHLQ